VLIGVDEGATLIVYPADTLAAGVRVRLDPAP
jgi:hypothetical protein